MKRNIYLILILTLAFLITTSGCVSNAQTTDITTADASINTVESTVAETKKEPTATAVVTKPTQKTNVTPTPTVKETTAATSKVTETAAPAATTKAIAAPVATTKAPAATTTAPAVTTATTAAPPVETAPPVATTAAYTPNCDNIKNYIVSNLQSRGYWFPDAVSIGNDSAALTTNYYYSDDKFAEGFLLKFTKLEEIGTMGVISVNVWIEDGYVHFSSTACAYPTA